MWELRNHRPGCDGSTCHHHSVVRACLNYVYHRIAPYDYPEVRLRMMSGAETAIMGSYSWTCSTLYMRVMQDYCPFFDFQLLHENVIIPENDTLVPRDVLNGVVIDIVITDVYEDSDE